MNKSYTFISKTTTPARKYENVSFIYLAYSGLFLFRSLLILSWYVLCRNERKCIHRCWHFWRQNNECKSLMGHHTSFYQKLTLSSFSLFYKVPLNVCWNTANVRLFLLARKLIFGREKVKNDLWNIEKEKVRELVLWVKMI